MTRDEYEQLVERQREINTRLAQINQEQGPGLEIQIDSPEWAERDQLMEEHEQITHRLKAETVEI